jgi:hypothetical protein
MVPTDGPELERIRIRQMVYLSHYGSEPSGYWQNRSVWELDGLYHAMSRIIAMENGENPPDD